jgi:DNA-binding response OmpR family regulator
MNAMLQPLKMSVTCDFQLAAWQTGITHTPVEQNSVFYPQTTPTARRILLADDDPGVRQMLGRLLETEHYAVTFAKTGREAATKFAANPPDLVLLDLNMPDKDGWEAFGMMCEKHPLIPVIVITARPHQYARAVELGVDALMEKPLNLPVLLDEIQHLLAESELERTRRLTNRNFKTAFLKQLLSDPSNGFNE